MKSPIDPAAMQATLLQQLGWRTRPGILGHHAASAQSIHALLGYFLNDRDSPTPFPGRDVLVDSGLFDWGVAPPLEKVISSRVELDLLLGLPEVYRHSVAVLEPWKNVGINLQGEEVRASKNIAYILQQVADADTILYPDLGERGDQRQAPGQYPRRRVSPPWSRAATRRCMTPPASTAPVPPAWRISSA